MLCNKNVDLAQYDAATGEIKGINWARATHTLCPQNESGKQVKEDIKVQKRNKHLREWNRKYRGDATHHVYYQVTEKTFQYLACQRPQCGLHIKPASWPHQQYRWVNAPGAFEQKATKCSGILTEWEKIKREEKPYYLLQYPDVYGEEDEKGKKSKKQCDPAQIGEKRRKNNSQKLVRALTSDNQGN